MSLFVVMRQKIHPTTKNVSKKRIGIWEADNWKELRQRLRKGGFDQEPGKYLAYKLPRAGKTVMHVKEPKKKKKRRWRRS